MYPFLHLYAALTWPLYVVDSNFVLLLSGVVEFPLACVPATPSARSMSSTRATATHARHASSLAMRPAMVAMMVAMTCLLLPRDRGAEPRSGVTRPWCLAKCYRETSTHPWSKSHSLHTWAGASDLLRRTAPGQSGCPHAAYSKPKPN